MLLEVKISKSWIVTCQDGPFYKSKLFNCQFIVSVNLSITNVWTAIVIRNLCQKWNTLTCNVWYLQLNTNILCEHKYSRIWLVQPESEWQQIFVTRKYRMFSSFEHILGIPPSILICCTTKIKFTFRRPSVQELVRTILLL